MRPGHDNNDTIAAMATAPGGSGIGIIRISGRDALSVAEKVFAASNGKPVRSQRSFTLRYGRVVRRDPAGEETVDEALCGVMRAPRSYTREDIVELNCHGGTAAMRRVLELVLESGCRLAEPGEFTRRAFLNGRIDLAQAEGVLDVIRARTDAALRAGQGQLNGELSRRLEQVRGWLMAALASREAAIDFPEDDAGSARPSRGALDKALASVRELLEGANRGRIYREGLSAVICGKPNAGKSSLLNALLREERSIVTPVAGTTRDTIEELIDIRGIPVRVTDTAGIREPCGQVERKALSRTRASIAAADLVILVFDGSRPLDRQDRLLMRRLKGSHCVAVVNKSDLVSRLALEPLRRAFGEPVLLSAKKRRNIAGLEEEICRRAGCAAAGAGTVLVTNVRHIHVLKKLKKSIEESVDCRDNELPAECAAQELRDACGLLDQLQGKDFSEELLDRIFSEFCIGK